MRIKTVFVLLLLFLLASSLLVSLFLVKGTFGQELYTVHVEAMDANGQPLDRVEVAVSDYGSFTVLGGSTSINLKGGSYNASVRYLGIPVCTKPFTVKDSTRLILNCQVFSLKVKIDLPHNLTEPHVDVRIGGTTTSLETDSQGVAFFKSLPSTKLLIFAYATMNESARLVGAKDLTLEKNSEVTLTYSEYYSLNVEVRDAQSELLRPPASAVVSVDGLSVDTDSSGSALLFASPGTRNLIVHLYNITVYQEKIEVGGDLSLRVNCTQIVPLYLTLLDEVMSPLNDSTVQVHIGSANLTVQTDGLGRVKIDQAPYVKGGSNFEVAVTGVNIPKQFVFKGDPVTVEGVVTHGLIVKWRVLGAYMLGFVSVSVTPMVGTRPVNNSVVTLLMDGRPVDVKKTTKTTSYVVVRGNLWLEPSVDLTVRVQAFGMNRTEKIPRISPSPLVPLTLPLSPLPLLLFVYLSREYRRRRLQAVPE